MNKNLERLKGFLMEVKKDKSCEGFIDITSIINSIPYDSTLKYDDELKELFELAESVNNRYFEALCLWFERNNRHIDHYNHWLENNISESGLKAVNVLYSMMIKDSIIDDTKYIQKFKDIIRESKTVKIENDKVLIKKENEKMESNVNLEKMIMSLGKDNTDFYVDFDTIADWVETKQVKNLSDFKALIESKGLVITYELSRALYNVIGNIDLLYDDKVILKNFRHKKNLANNENLKKLNNFLDNRIYLLKNKKKKEGNDTIENLKKAIDTKDKIKIGNIFAYQKYQNQYKHMAKLINSNIDVIQEDEIYNILNRSNSVEEFCCNTTMNLINRINSVKFVEGRAIELDETSLGMAENNYLDINNKIVLICGLDLNPKYNEAMNRKKKKYGTTNDSVFTILELVAYMKSNEYRDIYNQAKLINWAKENQKSHLNQYRIKYILQTLRSAIENKSEEGFDEIKSFLNIVNIKDQKIISIIDKLKNIVKNRQPMIDGIIGLFESLLLNFNDVKDRNIIADHINYILDCHKNDRKNISNNIKKITLKPMVPETENLTDPLSGVKQITRTLAFPIFSQKPLSLTTKPGRCIPVTSVQQSVDATTDVDKAIEISNNVSKTFGCGCHRDKTGNDLEEIIIDSLINDINHDLLDIVLTYYFDLTKDQREIVETINNISPEQEGNFRRFDNREFIDFVKRALKTEMTPFTIFTIKFDLFVKLNSQNYQDVINHIFVDNPLVFPGCADVEAFLINYTKLITNDLKLVKLPYEIFKNMVKEIEGKPYLSAYLELTKLMVPDKTHLIDEILSEIDNLKENDIFINMVNQCNDFDDLFEKYKLFSNSVSIVPVGFNGKEFLFKEIPVGRRPAKTIHLQKADRQKRQSIKALEIAKEKNNPIYQASNSMKESPIISALVIAKEKNDPIYQAISNSIKNGNDNIKMETVFTSPTCHMCGNTDGYDRKKYICNIIKDYNVAMERGYSFDKELIDFINLNSKNGYKVMSLDLTHQIRDCFYMTLMNWSKNNYPEVYTLMNKIIETNKIIISNGVDKSETYCTDILLLYSYVLELYKRIGYFDSGCINFCYYINFMMTHSTSEISSSEDYINLFGEAYNNYLDKNTK